MKKIKRRSILANFLLLCVSLLLFSNCAGQTNEPTHATFVQICHSDALDDAVCDTIQSASSEKDTQAFQVLYTPEEDVAIRNPSNIESPYWQFTPEFVFESTPEAAMERALQAIQKNNADEFCTDFENPVKCAKIFAQNTSLLHEVYVHKPKSSSMIWSSSWVFIQVDNRVVDKKVRPLVSTDIGPLTFIFSPTEKNDLKSWKLTDMCTTFPEHFPDFTPCK